MSVPKPASSWRPRFCDLLPFSVSHYVQEYVFYSAAFCSTDMCASDRSFTFCDRHSMLCDTDVGASDKGWLHCGEHGASVSRCVGFEDDFPFD